MHEQSVCKWALTPLLGILQFLMFLIIGIKPAHLKCMHMYVCVPVIAGGWRGVWLHSVPSLFCTGYFLSDMLSEQGYSVWERMGLILPSSHGFTNQNWPSLPHAVITGYEIRWALYTSFSGPTSKPDLTCTAAAAAAKKKVRGSDHRYIVCFILRENHMGFLTTAIWEPLLSLTLHNLVVKNLSHC